MGSVTLVTLVTDVFHDSDNLVEFRISSRYLPPIYAPSDGLVMTRTRTRKKNNTNNKWNVSVWTLELASRVDVLQYLGRQVAQLLNVVGAIAT